MSSHSFLWVWLSIAFLSGCAVAPSQRDDSSPHVPQIDLRAARLPACHEDPALSFKGGNCVFTPRERRDDREDEFRRSIGEPVWATREDAIGVSLSGGGTRAAASAMGVLAGLDDLKLLTHVPAGRTKKVEIVSSVSGGGYSAYFLFTHLLHEARPPTSQGELFQDCVTNFENSDYGTQRLRARLKPYFCEEGTYIQLKRPVQHAWAGDGVHQLARHQSLVRCHQDVLQPGRCSTNFTSQDTPIAVGGVIAQVGASFVTAIPHHVLNSLFDSGWNVSPSRAAYVDGIDATYGALVHPAFNPLFDQKRVLAKGRYMRAALTCPSTAPGEGNTGAANYSLFECDPVFSGPRPRRLSLAEFSARMNQARASVGGEPLDKGGMRNVPYWVIQATAAPTRGLAGWVMGGVLGRHHVHHDTFEFTANHFGSVRYGLVHGTPKDLELVDAVASSAAFLDSNQLSISSTVWRPVLGAAQHAFNANWGLDIPNYNVSPARRRLHQVLPFPLNNLDSLTNSMLYFDDEARADRQRSAFIRLLDGGNIDNLGLYAHIRRGVKNVVLADVSEDKGLLLDLCTLKRTLAAQPDPDQNEIQAQPSRHLYIPGLEKFEKHCDELLDDDEEDLGYDMRSWAHRLPMLVGCVQLGGPLAPDAQCIKAPGAEVITRLYIYKPSITRDAGKSIHPIAACKVITYDRVKEGSPTLSMLLTEEGLSGSCTDAQGEMLNACSQTLPCETARLMKAAATGYRFPLGSTVFATANSSGTLFAGYRELARHAIHGAHALIVGGEEAFKAAVVEQRQQPMRRVQLP